MSDENDGQNADAGDGATDQTSMADIAGTISDNGGAANTGQQASDNTGSQAADKGKPAGDNQQDMADFIASQRTAMESLTNEVQTANQAVQELTQRDQLNVLNQAVDDAVEKINTNVNGDSKLADTFLNSRYQNDPSFKKIFDNRGENPGAYDKALNILGDEWKAMNVNSIDSKVAENQRALQESQRTGVTADRGQPETERLAKLPDGNFLQEMSRLANSN